MSTFGADAIFGDVISDGLAGLQSALSQYGGAGITNPGGAIAGLQAAGTAAVKVVGPAIDILGGGDGKVKAITQGVWQTNARLAGLGGGGSAAGSQLTDVADDGSGGGLAMRSSNAQSDLAAAVSAVQSMLSQYSVAYRLAKSYKVSAAGQAAARAAGAPRPLAIARKAVPAATAPLTLAPTVSPGLGADANAVGAILGAVLGLTLGGAIGWSAGAKAGLAIGGPLGGATGALVGYLLTQQFAAPSSVPTA